MNRYFLRRLFWAIPVVLGIVLISFLLTRLVPGDPALALVGDFPISNEYLDEIRKKYGLDQPVYLQAFYYFSNLLQGDLGYSLGNRQPVLSLLWGRAVNTLLLVIPGLIISAIIGIGLGALALRKPGGRLDVGLNAFILILDSIPIFWLAQISIIVFSVNLGLLPTQGMFSIRGAPTGIGVVMDFLWHWILPGTVIVISSMVAVTRVARVSLLEVSRQDFITTAAAKGLSQKETLRLHIMPNAMIPVITVIGYSFGNAVTGAIMTEAVFGWPGLGGLFMAALSSRDYPVLQGIFLLTAFSVVFANLVTDIIYGFIDPRVSYES